MFFGSGLRRCFRCGIIHVRKLGKGSEFTVYLEEFRVGMTLDIPEAVIDKEEMLRFARLYDPLPLHTDEEYAKTTRFGAVIAPGVMSFMAVWAKFMENDIFADELIAGKSTKIEWFKPVFAEDVLTGKLRVSAVTPRNPYNGIVETTIDVYNQHSEKVLSNITESIVKRKAPV